MQDNKISMLSVWLSVSLFPPCQLFNQLVYFHEIQWGGHAIEGDLGTKIFNSVAATIPKW
jgi:hypothetical protein